MTYPQQPQTWYPRPDNPGTAILAGVLGLVVGICLLVIDIRVLNAYSAVSEFSGGRSSGAVSGQSSLLLILQVIATVLPLIGSLLVLARKAVGLRFLVTGVIIALATVLAYPLLIFGNVPGFVYQLYFDFVFSFATTEATMLAIVILACPLAFIFALLPSTATYLKRSYPMPYPPTGGTPPPAAGPGGFPGMS